MVSSSRDGQKLVLAGGVRPPDGSQRNMASGGKVPMKRPKSCQTINKGKTQKKGNTQSSSNTCNKTSKEVLMEELTFTPKSRIEDILVIEPEDLSWFNNPWDIKQKYLGPDNLSAPGSMSRIIYEKILVAEGSVQFEHTRQEPNNANSIIRYSKATICKVIHPAIWGNVLSVTKNISLNGTRISYNYWDYIDAWSNAFYFQNPSKKHTWLIRLSQDLEEAKLPYWFLEWWDKFGPNTNILPKEINNLFDIWCENHPLFYKKENIPFGAPLLVLFIHFSFPWIFKWDLKIDYNMLNFPVLQRTFHQKWWKNYRDIKSNVQIMKEECQKFMATTKKEKNSLNPFDAMKVSIKSQFPNLPDEAILVKCMDSMKEHFLQNSIAKAGNDNTSMTLDNFEPYLPGES